jgi:hypothetical protein
MACVQDLDRVGDFNVTYSARNWNFAQRVGRTPWSARVPLDPLFTRLTKSAPCNPRKADRGVGCGPGGPPYN